MKPITILLAVIASFNCYSQKIIEMENINGVYQIPCKVNGVEMKFIFDTGASDVTISITEAKFLIKQGLLKKEDFIENVNYQIANGNILDGTKINLETIDIAGIILKNVFATVIHEQNAPLLLGQSAISKLGEYSIRGNKLTIFNSTVESENKQFFLKEINDTFNWIKNMVSQYQYEDSNTKMQYQLELEESASGGFIISVNENEINKEKKNDNFIVDIKFIIQNIKSVQPLIDKTNENMKHIILVGDKDDAFVTSYYGNVLMYSFRLHQMIEIENIDQRLVSAFDNLIKYNKLYLDSTSKF